MNETYLNVIAQAGAGVITHIGLVDDQGDEISGGNPAYARQSVTWDVTGGVVRPDDDLVFDIPADVTVQGWQGYSASTGGTAYGIVDLGGDSANFTLQGTYTLEVAKTSITHKVGS